MKNNWRKIFTEFLFWKCYYNGTSLKWPTAALAKISQVRGVPFANRKNSLGLANCGHFRGGGGGGGQLT